MGVIGKPTVTIDDSQDIETTKPFNIEEDKDTGELRSELNTRVDKKTKELWKWH